MANTLLSWHFVTQEAYDAASAADKANKIYFTSDTKKIYREALPFSEGFEFVTADPTTPATGRVYFNSSTLEGKVWNGSAWVTVIQPVQDSLSETDTTLPVSGKAVADYVASSIGSSADIVSGLSFDQTTNTWTITKGDDSTETVTLSNVAVDLAYDTDTGLLQVKNAAGTIIGTGINLDLERFVKSGEYDTENKNIILYFDDEKTDSITIPAGALVDTYTAKSSSTISLTVTDNEFTAEAIVATTDGNMLQATDSGLYVAATDISGKMDLVSGAVADDLVKLNAAGQVVDAGVTIGGSALATTPSASTLATEAAVEAIRAALDAAKMNLVSGAVADDIATLDATGQVVDSGKAIGGATLASTPNANTVATEAAVAAYAVAKTDIVTSSTLDTSNTSDEKVLSEAAIVDALTWKTSV